MNPLVTTHEPSSLGVQRLESQGLWSKVYKGFRSFGVHMEQEFRQFGLSGGLGGFARV